MISLFLAAAVTGSVISPNCHHPDNEYRSRAVLHDFDRSTGHPNGWPGHVRDHICPLACGGSDVVENLQWQTIADGKKKDRIERTPIGFELYCNRQIMP